MARLRSKLFRQFEAASLLELVAVEMRCELVGLVENCEVPSRGAEFVLQVLVARHLVEANDEMINVLERVPARSSGLQIFGKNAKL